MSSPMTSSDRRSCRWPAPSLLRRPETARRRNGNESPSPSGSLSWSENRPASPPPLIDHGSLKSYRNWWKSRPIPKKLLRNRSSSSRSAHRRRPSADRSSKRTRSRCRSRAADSRSSRTLASRPSSRLNKSGRRPKISNGPASASSKRKSNPSGNHLRHPLPESADHSDPGRPFFKNQRQTFS